MSRFKITWGFGRRGRSYYYVRICGWVHDEERGARRLDTDEKIPDDWFERVQTPAREQTPRGDVLAANYASKRERELLEQPLRVKSATTRSLGELWLKKRQRKDPKTIASDQLYLSILEEYFRDRDAATIDIGALENLRDWLLDRDVIARTGTRAVRKMSPRTAANILSFANRLYVWGYARKRETGMNALELPPGKEGIPDVEGKEGRGGARRPTLGEIWRIYAAAGELPLVSLKSQAIIALGFATWLRLEALLNLQRSWIDFSARTVTIPPEFMKGGKSELVLPLNRFALAAIERALALHEHGRYVLPINPKTGRPSTNLHHTLRKIATIAGTRPFSLHGLRKAGSNVMLNHVCRTCRNCRTTRAAHSGERCPTGATTFFAVHPSGVPKIVVDRILAHEMPRNDRAYYEVDLDLMRDALSVIDEEWDQYNRREGTKVIEIAARRA